MEREPFLLLLLVLFSFLCSCCLLFCLSVLLPSGLADNLNKSFLLSSSWSNLLLLSLLFRGLEEEEEEEEEEGSLD